MQLKPFLLERLGFAAAGDNFSKALDRFGGFVKTWSAKMMTA